MVREDDWLFYDYSSLHQFLRTTADEESSFRKAMGNMQVIYCHEFTMTYRIEDLAPPNLRDMEKTCSIYHVPSAALAEVSLAEVTDNDTDYLERGWCAAEMQWSQSRSNTDSTWRITDNGLDREESKRAPMPPEIFRSLAEEGKLKFTHRSDLEPVLHLQETVFIQKAKACESLSLSRVEPAPRLSF